MLFQVRGVPVWMRIRFQILIQPLTFTRIKRRKTRSPEKPCQLFFASYGANLFSHEENNRRVSASRDQILEQLNKGFCWDNRRETASPRWASFEVSKLCWAPLYQLKFRCLKICLQNVPTKKESAGSSCIFDSLDLFGSFRLSAFLLKLSSITWHFSIFFRGNWRRESNERTKINAMSCGKTVQNSLGGGSPREIWPRYFAAAIGRGQVLCQ